MLNWLKAKQDRGDNADENDEVASSARPDDFFDRRR
jgi:hypothetical protein